MREKFERLKGLFEESKKEIIVSFGIFLFIILILLIFVGLGAKKGGLGESGFENKLEDGLGSAVPSVERVSPETGEIFSGPAPQVEFKNYNNKAGFPQVPEKVKTYYFKNNYTRSEALLFGSRFGLSDFKENGSQIVLYNAKDKDQAGILFFDKNTGKFLFESVFGLLPLLPFSDPKLTAKSFLTQAGLFDGETIDCLIAYKKPEKAGAVFVECHRDWEKTGLPILSFVGTVNLGENIRLGELGVGMEAVFGERPTDFNSATVGVGEDGRILSIESNLRQIIKVSQAELLKTPQEALEEFTNHNAEFSLTMPIAGGRFNSKLVYPQNTARAKLAEITDSELVYLEKPGGVVQEKLEPYYLIRGTAELESGYKVKFAEAVSALVDRPLADAKGFNSFFAPSVLAQGSLQLGSFTPPPDEPSPSAAPELFVPTITGEPRRIEKGKTCSPGEEDLNPVYYLGDLGKVGYWLRGAAAKGPGYRELGFYYYVRPQQQALPSLDDVIFAFEALSLEQGITNVRPFEKIRSVWVESIECPLRFTGGSPTLFVYGRGLNKADINIKREIYYYEENPANGYIYYEYKPVEWEKPESGELRVKNGELEEFVRKELAVKMRLTKPEEERLVFEFKNASKDIKEPYISVGLIDESEVDEKLPLFVLPAPELIVRRHFYLEGQGSNKTNRTNKTYNTKITPIPRAEYMVLELGAVSFP